MGAKPWPSFMVEYMKINSKTLEILSLVVESYKREKLFYRFQLEISCFIIIFS